MGETTNTQFQLFNDPLGLYNAMLEDIGYAKRYIYIETYRFANDSIGIKFKEALTRKAKEGVEIKLLVDSWGTTMNYNAFKELIENGGEVRYFNKLKFVFDYFTKNHRRNHRKLMIIDDEINYIGSANIVSYSLHWRELVLKTKGELTHYFKRAFLENFDQNKAYRFHKIKHKKTIRFRDWEIIRDVPSIYRQKLKRRYEELIEGSKSNIYIETPYFVPGFKLRRDLMAAAQRGVEVKIIMPLHSDVRIVDILRNKYLGILHESGIKFLLYKPTNLHAKSFLVDNEVFVIGSANFDYRSFRYQFEIALLGKDKGIIGELTKHVNQTIADCVPFDYDSWRKRPRIQKLFEYILLPFRHLL